MDEATAFRFWAKVDRRGPDECWPWTAYVTWGGYGLFTLDGRKQVSSRVAWQLERGPIPDGLHVLHHCDNPPCCNYERCLFLVMRADNMRDMIAKGRRHDSRGEANSFSKTTAEDVRAIRALAADGVYQREIAQRFGLGTSTISLIVRRERWSHVE